MIPKTLNEWTYEVIEDLVKRNVFESKEFDFKEALPTKDKDKIKLRKTASAFANSEGGFLIYGVKDDKGLDFKDRIVGIDKNYDFQANYGNFPAECSPSVDWELKNPPITMKDSDKIIHIIYIKSTWMKPHAVKKGEQFYFIKRTEKGNQNMSYQEVKSMFQEQEYRRTKLALLNAELQSIIEISDNLLDQEKVMEFVKDEDNDTTKYVDSSLYINYSTFLLDQVLGDAYSFIAEKPIIWKNLNKIRSLILKSNTITNLLLDSFKYDLKLNMMVSFQTLESVVNGIKSCANTALSEIDSILKN